MGKKKKTFLDELKEAADKLGFPENYIDDVVAEIDQLNELFDKHNVDSVATVGEVKSATPEDKFLVIVYKWDEFRDAEVATIDNYKEDEYGGGEFEWNGYSCWWNREEDDREFKKLGDGKWLWSVYKIKK